MEDRVLTEEVFDEILENMDNRFKSYPTWNSSHPAVSPWTARKIKQEYKTHCPFCGLTWEKCKKWRDRENANSSSTGDFSFDNLDF